LCPIPARYAKRIDGLAIPLCRDHFDDCETARFRARVGAALVLFGTVVTAAAAWELLPLIAPQNIKNENGRISLTIIVGFLSAIPLGLLAVSWVKSSIRVVSVNGRRTIVAGVCRDFAAAFRDRPQPAPPDTPDSVRFPVEEYRPVWNCPTDLSVRVLAVVAAVAVIIGVAIAFASIEIAEATAAWAPHDWRFLCLSAAVAIAFFVPFFKTYAFTRSGVLILGLLGGLACLMPLGLACFGLSFRWGFGVVLTGGPLFLLAAVANPILIRRWRIRGTRLATVAGLSGPLLFAGAIYLVAGTEPGPHRVAYLLGPITAVTGLFLNRHLARQPFCSACEAWLIDRRIGALPSSREEIQPLIASGQIAALAALRAYEETAEIGETELHVHYCESCRESGTVVLELFESKKSGDDGKTPSIASVGRWLYPGTALPVIEEIYPLPQEGSLKKLGEEPNQG